MKFREWMRTPVDISDIWTRCLDPTGEDKDNIIMPLGTAAEPKHLNYLHNEINTKLVLYSFTITDEMRFAYKGSMFDIKNIHKTGNRCRVKDILDKRYSMTTFSQNEYYKEIGKHKFVISPEGNGIDCFRHYETWISKGIPIIQHNEFMRRKYSGLPILWTDDYSEITDEYLETKYNEFLNKDFDFRRILLSSYSLEIQRQIKHTIQYNHTISKTKSDITTTATKHGFWNFEDYFQLLEKVEQN